MKRIDVKVYAKTLVHNARSASSLMESGSGMWRNRLLFDPLTTRLRIRPEDSVGSSIWGNWPHEALWLILFPYCRPTSLLHLFSLPSPPLSAYLLGVSTPLRRRRTLYLPLEPAPFPTAIPAERSATCPITTVLYIYDPRNISATCDCCFEILVRPSDAIFYTEPRGALRVSLDQCLHSGPWRE